MDLEMQMEKQRQDIAEKQEEIKGLQTALDRLDPKDPKHVSELRHRALFCTGEGRQQVSHHGCKQNHF